MVEPIKVLQVVTQMNRGGLETMLMNYYRNIDRSKVQFDFLTHRNGEKDYDSEILSLGGKIYCLPSLNPFDRKYLRQIDDFFRDHTEYKIVHSHLNCMSTYPLKYARKYGVPVRIAHSHNSGQKRNLKYLVKIYSRSQITKYATHLAACSEQAGKWMYGKSDFIIINNAIDAGKFIFDENTFNKMRRELNIENKFVIGHVGRFDIQKNHSFIIDIFEEVYKKNKDSVLILVGLGDLKEDIEQKVKRLGFSEAVMFLGLRNDIQDVLQPFDVFLFPSLYEGLGISVVEAQASGLHCIVSENIPKEAYVTDLIEAISLKLPAGVWAERILNYQYGYGRKDTYEQIKSNGYDITVTAKWLEKFYLSALANLK